VFDKTKEKDGKNTAIYELHTGVEQNLQTLHFLKGIIERLLRQIEPDRFGVLLENDTNDDRHVPSTVPPL